MRYNLERSIEAIITLSVCSKCPKCDILHSLRCLAMYKQQAEAVASHILTFYDIKEKEDEVQVSKVCH